jgi:hypothetical protein
VIDNCMTLLILYPIVIILECHIVVVCIFLVVLYVILIILYFTHRCLLKAIQR